MTQESEADWPNTLVALRPPRRLSALAGFTFYVSIIAALVILANHSEIGWPVASLVLVALAVIAANGFALGQVRDNRQFIVFPPWTCRGRSRWGFGSAIVFASETWRARLCAWPSWRTVVRCDVPGPGAPVGDLFQPLQGFDDLLRACVVVGQRAEAAVRRDEVAIVVEGVRCSPEQLAHMLRSCAELAQELPSRQDQTAGPDLVGVGARHLTDTIKEAFRATPALWGDGSVSRVGPSAVAPPEDARSPGVFRVSAVVETVVGLPRKQDPGPLRESRVQQDNVGVAPGLALALLVLWYSPILVLPAFGSNTILLQLGFFWSVVLPLTLWTASALLARSFARRWQGRLFPLGRVAVTLRGVSAHGRFRGDEGGEVEIASSVVGWFVRTRTVAARCARARPPPAGSFAYARFTEIEARLISLLGPSVRVAAIANESKAFVLVEGTGPVSGQDCRAVAAAALEIGEEWDARRGTGHGRAADQAADHVRSEAVELAAHSLFLKSHLLVVRRVVKELNGRGAT